jgi:hypothetical protein
VAGDGYDVQCDDWDVAAEIERWSAPLVGPSTGRITLKLISRDAGGPRLEVEGGPGRPVAMPEDLFPALEGLVYERLARPSRGLVILHAAVAVRGRRAALFVGDSGAGKSVLSLNLEARGWTYASDDLAPIDHDGQVVAVPRPVSFDQSEIEPELWQALASGRTHFSRTLRARSGEAVTALYVVPQRRSASGQRFPIGAIFRLARGAPGRPGTLARLPHAEMRALLFAQRARARAAARPQA